MKRNITRTFLALLLCAISLSSFAQDEINTEFINRMNYVFSALEKNRVPNGLLLDYSFEFADLKSYSGVLTDSNKVNGGFLRDIYSTIAMSAIHTNAGGFYSPDYVDSIWHLQRQAGIITLSGVYYNYARFKDNALSSGLLTVSNDKFYDRYVNGVWQNPYQAETVFAMSPPLHAYSGKSFQVVLPSNLWFTNNAGSVSSIAVNFDDGAGYRTLTMGQPVNISYADTGRKTWTFRLTLSNNTTLYSHTEMQIEPEPNAYGSGCSSCRFPRPGGPIFLTADEAYLGQFGQGWITVDYANADLKLRRPLIVVEGFDPGHLLAPERQFGYSNFVTFVAQLNGSFDLRNLLQGNNQQYDIIYVDWFRGTDFLQRNALLLERVIRWVNEQKALDGSNEPNVILGQSMGGVIARWALRDMENKNLNHQTRLYISWDAPHQGANVPVSYQHAARHANSLFVQSAIPLLLGGNNTIRMVRNALNLLDVPAARQMLYNRVLNNGQLSNNDHNAWQTELRNMGYPVGFPQQQIRNIAVSNGSECGAGQGFQPGATLLNIVGRGNTRVLTDLIGSFTGPGLGFWGGLSLLTLKPQFLLGIIPGRNDLSLNVRCQAQPEGTTIQIYRGNITYSKKILWLVNVNTTITNRTRNSDPSVLPIDGTPGGMYDTELNMQSSSFQNWAVKYNVTAYNIPHFNFIPTVSALDIGRGNTALTMAEYRASYVGANPPAAPFNTPFANFTTAFNQVIVSNGTANNNENHIEIAARNGNFVAAELNAAPIQTNCSDFCGLFINGADAICDNGTFTVPAIAGATYTWTVNNSFLINIFPNNNSIDITRRRQGSANITITVQITSGDCGTITVSRTFQFGVLPTTIIGPYDITQHTVMGVAYTNTTYYFLAGETSPHFPAQSYTWTLFPPTGNPTLYAGGQPYITFAETGYHTLQVSKMTNCGAVVSSIIINVQENMSGFRVMAAPNPVTNDVMNVTIDNESSQVQSLPQNGNMMVEMFHFNSAMKRKQWTLKNHQKQFQLNLRGVPKGNYILRITKGNYQQSRQIIVE
ncbi:MAG: T9SS type A sorting domain-containing protein [Chitinophagaceae bacterium]|nr:T9SS type A sorting domain-containing protein [Chitinophagaceae bacterium]